MADVTQPKRCADCGVVKEPKAFGFRYKRLKSGIDSPFLHSYCKSCVYERNKKRREAGLTKSDPRYHRLWKLRNKYGLSETQYEEMIALQDYSCVICEEELGDHPHVDHDHDTGVVRGILCGPCNKGLGMFKDDLWRLEQAVKYLRENK